MFFHFGFRPDWETQFTEGKASEPPAECLENPMDRGAWRATVYGVARVGHDLATYMKNDYQGLFQ